MKTTAQNKAAAKRNQMAEDDNSGTRKDVRTTVSFAGVVWELLEKQMELRGFNNNVSAYLADLVRRDRERSRMEAREPLDENPHPSRAG